MRKQNQGQLHTFPPTGLYFRSKIYRVNSNFFVSFYQVYRVGTVKNI